MANIERTLETLVDFADVHRQSLVRLHEAIEALTHQIGVLSENMTRLENKVERIFDAIEADREVAKMQSTSVQQMIALAATQQQTINTLVAKLAA